MPRWPRPSPASSPAGSAEATAAAICDELLGLPGIDVAVIVNFLDPQRAVPLAVSGPDGLPMAPGRPLPAARARYLYERAAQGPWAEAWRPRPEDGAYGRVMAELGIRAVAYAPIRNGDGLLGVVAAGTRDEAYVRHLIDHLPAVGEFAATASALLSGQLERGHRDELVRERVRRALAEGGLRPVFQPIVALASGEPVGYEALTRFADGTPPDRMIADAHSVGLGLELEVACLAAALDAVRNAGARLLAQPECLARRDPSLDRTCRAPARSVAPVRDRGHRARRDRRLRRGPPLRSPASGPRSASPSTTRALASQAFATSSNSGRGSSSSTSASCVTWIAT